MTEAEIIHIEDDDRNADICGNCGAWYHWTEYCPECGCKLIREGAKE